MFRSLRTGGLLLCLLTLLRSPVARAAEPPEPPPASVTDEEPPPAEREPEPSPLREDPEQLALARQQAARRASIERSRRAYQVTGTIGAALTAAFVVSGITVGLLAQRRSDELTLLTVQRENGLAPTYDAAQRQQFEQVQQDGHSFQRATIACFVTAGATALGSGILFWQVNRKDSALKKLALRPLPLFSQQQFALTLSGSW
jgi:hypothetical protein